MLQVKGRKEIHRDLTRVTLEIITSSSNGFKSNVPIGAKYFNWIILIIISKSMWFVLLLVPVYR